MTEARWAQVKALFQAAVERPASERAEFLHAAAGSDELLRREVESLLRSDDPDAALTKLLQRQDAVRAAPIDTSDVSSADTRTHTASATVTTIGPYRGVSLLGAGGMGEVFRARDSKLHRDVALKLLPQAFAADPERLARFRREARALAALNHPHIGAIYGLDESDGRQALVLELVEGVTLAERIARGPLPVREALTLARQMATALEAAHDKGIVHRDLKPANIKVTTAGVVKVLDFGLAKTAAAERAAAETVSSSSTADGWTRVGAVMGTAAYMSPEQARGLDVDQRTDVWAFGCVLFEMLSGRKAFGADADSDSTEKVLAREPDWTALPATTPVKVRGLLERCLTKDPGRRLQTIAEAHQLVDRLLKGGSLPKRVAALAVAVAVLATAAVIYVWRQPPRQTGTSDWVQLTNLDVASQPALSRDESLLAFIRGPASRTVGEGQIYIKPLPNGEAVPLTDDAYAKGYPVFSPDQTRIAYSAGSNDTWIAPVLRGAGAPYEWLQNASGLTWHGRNEILFSAYEDGVHHPLGIATSAESRQDARFIYFPTLPASMAHSSYRSPDGRWVLLAEMDGPGAFLPCRLVPFDGSSAGRTVGPRAPANHVGDQCTHAGWSPDGDWMFFSANAGDGFRLWRQRFPDGAVEQLTSGPTEQMGLAVSASGKSLLTSVVDRKQAVLLHDAKGDQQISVEGSATRPLLSGDGQKICYVLRKSPEAPGELRVTDLTSRRTERLFPGETVTGFDLRDDRIVAAVLEPDGVQQVWLASLDGQTPPRRIPMARGRAAGSLEPRFGPPGEIIFRVGPQNRLLRVNEDGSGLRQLDPGSVRLLGRTSPDGKWISGHRGTGAVNPVWLFSLTGADPLLFLQERDDRMLRWAPDGSRLYISRLNNPRTYVVPLKNGSMLPPMPSGGFRTEEEIAALPGVTMMPHRDVSPGPSPNVYVFSQSTVSSNIYRIPLP